MNTQYHIEITQQTLADHFSTKALNTVIKANIQQDKIIYLFGHDHFHFDGNAFKESFAYITAQSERVIKSIEYSDFEMARNAFGRLLHTWQDFYSHSNYVELWMDKVGQASPEEIVHNDEDIMQHPDLISGKNYGLVEFFAMVPLLSGVVKPLMPSDSHAQMNLDGPGAGALFEFAYWGALKRTIAAYNGIMLQLNEKDISRHQINHFLGK